MKGWEGGAPRNSPADAEVRSSPPLPICFVATRSRSLDGTMHYELITCKLSRHEVTLLGTR